MNTPSDKKIRALADEAAAHGDDMQLLICYRALEEKFDTDDYTGGGHRITSEQWKKLRRMTQDQARALCAAAINYET